MEGSKQQQQSVHNRAEDQRTLGLFGLLVISFFWVSGGIYGNEELLSAAPPAYVFGALLAGPFLYSLPVCLMVAETATALPYDGGLVAWVHEACGATLGGHNWYWLFLSDMLDSAVYPALAATYLGDVVPLGAAGIDERLAQGLIATGIVLFVTLIKLCGTNVLVSFSMLLLVLSLLPTFIYIFWGFTIEKPELWVRTEFLQPDSEPDWPLLVSWVLWLYAGFFSVGAVAGEVQNPKRTFPLVLAILLPVVFALNALPLTVAISQDSDETNYESGYFTPLAAELGGEWLGICFVIGSQLCLVGTYNSQQISCERGVLFLIQEHFGSFLARRSKQGSRVSRWLWTDNGTGAPPAIILVNTVVVGVLVWLPYTILVEMSMLLTVMVGNMFMYSYVWLKWRRPELDRPFNVPGGVPAAVAVAIIPFAINAVNFFLSVTDGTPQEDLGIPYFKLIGVVSSVAFGIFCDVGWRYRHRLPWIHSPSPGFGYSELDATQGQGQGQDQEVTVHNETQPLIPVRAMSEC